MPRYQNRQPLVITAGFPCQDASLANPKGLGIKGNRTGLFFEVARLYSELQPDYGILENVAGILIRGWEVCLNEIAKMGYILWYRTISAAAFGYPYEGKRVLCVAFSQANGIGLRQVQLFDRIFEKTCNQVRISRSEQHLSDDLKPEMYPLFCAEDNGISPRVAQLRLHAIGNAICPDFGDVIFSSLKTFHSIVYGDI